jgi:UDP-glucose 4-epimerase
VGDHEALDRIFKMHSLDAVIHFKALAYVGESMRNPGIYFDNNVADLARAHLAAFHYLESGGQSVASKFGYWKGAFHRGGDFCG